jgi:hypothetical protein
MAAEGSREQLKLSEYAAGLGREVCQGAIWLLITCPDLDAPLKSVRYRGITVFNQEGQGLIYILAVCGKIEAFIQATRTPAQ